MRPSSRWMVWRQDVSGLAADWGRMLTPTQFGSNAAIPTPARNLSANSLSVWSGKPDLIGGSGFAPRAERVGAGGAREHRATLNGPCESTESQAWKCHGAAPHRRPRIWRRRRTAHRIPARLMSLRANGGQPTGFHTRLGIHETMYRGRPWTMRQFSGFATPERPTTAITTCSRRGKPAVGAIRKTPLRTRRIRPKGRRSRTLSEAGGTLWQAARSDCMSCWMARWFSKPSANFPKA